LILILLVSLNLGKLNPGFKISSTARKFGHRLWREPNSASFYGWISCILLEGFVNTGQDLSLCASSGARKRTKTPPTTLLRIYEPVKQS
jgi:hypothetical protein